jgi:hypothetical protein
MLVEDKIRELRVLASKAQLGNDIEKELHEKLDEICDHFKAVAEDSNENLKRLKGRIKIVIDSTSDPLYKETFEKALTILPEKL